MNARSLPRLSSYFQTVARTLIASLCPLAALAEPVVFNTNFSTDTIHAVPGAITPTATNWYIMSSKNANATTVSGTGGLNLTYSPGSSAAGVQGVARFTTSPIALTAVGDSITATATLFTDNVLNLAVGLYNSNGVNPLTTLQNSGLSSAVYAGAQTDGTFAWKGYRARLGTGSTTGTISARPAQSGTSLTQQAFDVAAVNTGDFNSVGPISIGSVPASATAVTLADGYGAEYRLSYTITRSATDAYTISYTIKDSSDAVLYSVSGVTSTTGTRPAELTTAFDAIAFGTRNNTVTAASTISTLSITALSVTASNANIAKIVNQPIAQTWVTGQSGSISVVASGNEPLAYQWYKDGSPIESATSATYSVSSPTGDNAGNYHVVVSNAFGQETSTAVSVSLASASSPSFTVQPAASLTVNEGETLTLTATASGAPTPAYQWQKDSGAGFANISGAVFPTLTILSTTTADAASYRLVATNSGGNTTSDVAVVTINSQAPAITLDPIPAVVNVGAAITLTATASGYPAPTYQWYKGIAPSGTSISGATGASYTVASATTPDNGSYYVVATNRLGSATSIDTTVTVTVVAPAITTHPSSTTVTLGQPATFTVAASGSAPLFYQWYKGDTLIDGATSASHTINPTIGTSAGDYRVVVTNEGGPSTAATSNLATLNLIVTETTTVFATTFANDAINPPSPVITPTSTAWYVLSSKNAQTCNMGDDPLTTEVVETRPFTMTLELPSSSAFFQTAARFTNTPVNLTQVGSQLRLTTTFTTQNILTLGFGLYNSSGSFPKHLAFDNPALTADQRTVLGSSGTSAVGAGTQNWVGYRATLGNLAGTGNVGQGIATRPAQTNSASNRGQELCVTGSGSVSYGEPAGISVGVTKTPASDASGTLVNNSTYTLVYSISRTAADQYTIAYQIYQGTGTGGALFRAASGTTSATAPVPPALGNRPSDVTQSFDALAIGMRNAGPGTGPVPNFVFSSVEVSHSVPVEAVFPSVSIAPASQTISLDAPFTLTATAAGSPTPTYQWYKGTTLLSGQTASTYTVASATVDDAGDYTVVVTNALGSATSNVATVTVQSASSPFDSWATSQGLNSGNNSPTADPDSDGTVNLVEFVLGGNPLSASSAPAPVVARNGADLTFTYDVKTTALTQFSVRAETTSDLAGTWTPVTHGSGGVTIATTPVNASTDRVVVTVSGAGARLFIRLRVQALP
jgi:hypothetical protein